MAIQPRMSTVVIYQGDYIDRIRHLERKAEAAREAAENTARTLDETPEYLTLAEQHDALVKEAKETASHVVVQSLRRSSWKALVNEHPPREGNRGDATLGVNEETFRDALVAFVNEDDPKDRTIVEGLDLDDLDYLSDVDHERLYLTAFALNRVAGDPGKANLVSRLTQPSDETSN